MDNTITSGIINYPILYFNHYHQQEIVDRIMSSVHKIYSKLRSEEYIIKNKEKIQRREIDAQSRVKIIDFNDLMVNYDATWAKSPDFDKIENYNLEWMYTKELKEIITNMDAMIECNGTSNDPCVYIFRSVSFNLLQNNAEFISYLHKFVSQHERLQRITPDADLNWTIVLLVPSGEVPPPSVEGLVRLISVTPPDKDEIELEIKKVFKDPGSSEKEEFCKSLQGLQLYDIRQIIRSTKTVIGDKLSYRSIQWAREEKQQIIRKTGILEVVTPNVSFEDIGGLTTLKNDLENKASIYKHLGILQNDRVNCQVPKGVLLIGMPGCGKTMIAKSIASNFELPLLRLDIGKLLGQYVGQSEANLRRALDVVESAHPCVLWIDEIEKAFAGTSSKSGDNNDLMMRLMGTFLTWMQERDNQKNPVYIVATANDVMKPEFMRKGRFDEVYFVDFPNKAERADIAKAIAREYAKDKDSIIKFNLSDKEWDSLSDDMRIDTVRRKSKLGLGLSGAEIRSLISAVVEAKCLKRIRDFEGNVKNLQMGESDFIGKGNVVITQNDFKDLLIDFKQSAMILQSKWLYREEVDDADNLENEVDAMDERNNFIDRIYAKQMQYHFKSATK